MYAFFYAWLLSMSTKFVQFMHFVVKIITCLVSVLQNIPLYEFTTIYLLNFDRHCGCLQFGPLCIELLKHSSRCLFVNRYTQEQNLLSYTCVVRLSRHSQSFQKWLYQSTFPPAVTESSRCSIYSPIIEYFLFHFSYPSMRWHQIMV